jgi:drug/metabolite transporter (DMT)-like permease
MPHSKTFQAYIPSLALILAMVLWSSSFIALKIAFRGYDPMVVIFGRMLVASLCFLCVGKRLARSLDYRTGDYKPILFMAFCEPCLYFIFEAKAIENTTASQAGLITAMLPILVMIAASLFLKEIISRKAWYGAILAVLGVCWLTAGSTPSADAPNPILGNFYEFLAMICAAGYTISLKKLTDRYSPFFLTATQAVVGSVFYLPLLFLPGTNLPDTFEPVPSIAVIYLGAVITLGAYGLYNFGLKHVPASRAAIFVNLIPVFSVILGGLILHETLSATQSVAAVVVMIGVFLSQQQQQEA